MEERKALGLPMRQKREKKVKVDSFVNGKPVVHITGNEETGFDFWKTLRSALRPLRMNKQCDFLTREIVNPDYWKNIGRIKSILSVYVHLVEPEVKEKKVKKERKKRNLTEEQRQELRERMAKARAARKKG